MIRCKPEFQSIDLSAWPSIAWTELDGEAREVMKRRIEAVERYARGERVKDIEKLTGVNRRQIYRWLERGLASHPDGRIFGFRALLAYVRVNEYVRVSPVNGRPSEDGSGKAGAFALFLERFPTLAVWLLLKVKQRRVSLEQVHTDGRLRTRLVGLHALHAEFLWQCRSLGLTAVDYPFNTDGHAIRSLSARLKVELLRSQLIVIGAACREVIGNFPESGLERLLVLRDAEVLLDCGHIQVGLVRPSGQGTVLLRLFDLRQAERPPSASGLEFVRYLS